MKVEMNHPLGRRDFVKAGLAGLAVAGLGAGAARAAEKPKKIPIGLQLYSVRNQCQKDLPGVLKAVAGMGYQGVEFAGYYGRDAKQLKKLLDDNGLRCCGTHTGFNTILGDELAKTVEFNQTIGNPFLIVPGMPGERLASREACLKTAELFNEIADKLKPEKMVVGYHAHGGDFKKIGDSTPWEIFFGNTKPEVVMQLDIGNCIGGGGDPYALLRKFPGRSATIHLKEHGGPKTAVIGEGDVKWKEIFDLCESQGKTKWYIVEHERGGPDPMGDVKRCLVNLRKMGK